jgi:ribose transport system substrate-binding protein
MSFRKLFSLLLILTLLMVAVGSFVQAQDEEEFSEEEIASSEYLQEILTQAETTYDTSEFATDGPYRIALAAQGTSQSWSALFDQHAFWYADELGDDVIEELLYADAMASADVQVPQVEDLLAQDIDALILVPMGEAALSAPVERAMAQGVPVVVCASRVETDNFVTEVGTNLYASGRNLAQWLVDELGGEGNVVMMTGIPGVTTAEVMNQGGRAVWEASDGITVLEDQPGNWSTADAKGVMEQWIATHGEDIDGIWSGGAQMSQGIISAYQDAGLEVPPLAGGEFANGFLRLAAEEELTFQAWQYPNAMVTLCIDAAVSILRGEDVPRFIDFRDHIPNTNNFTSDDIDDFFNPNWTDDVFGPILFPDDMLEDLGFITE